MIWIKEISLSSGLIVDVYTNETGGRTYVGDFGVGTMLWDTSLCSIKEMEELISFEKEIGE